MLWYFCISLVFLPVLIVGHGAMTFPKPRNSLDGALAPWSGWAFPCDEQHQGENCTISLSYNGVNTQGSCPIAAHNGDKMALNASNGQACYWFSNGCTIGCDKCDGTQNHVGHGDQRFRYKGMTGAELLSKGLTIPDPFTPAPGDLVLGPETTKDLRIVPNCDHPTTNATVCDPRLRTCNTQAECGSKDDFYYYSPWRAPGSAPVIDSCGSAGGRFPGQGTGIAAASFQNSSLAKQGDAGSSLPAMPAQATWTAGSTPEVSWTIMANHGGGYAYRLCPADQPPTEECFRKTALDFVGNSVLRWGGDKRTQLEFNTTARGWETNVGTVPAGSMWRKNPVPSGLWEREGATFQPVCDESFACLEALSHWPTKDTFVTGVCRCSFSSNVGPGGLLPNLEIVDKVQIPPGLSPGHYVLQFRWDCEETDQVWASCADVEIR